MRPRSGATMTTISESSLWIVLNENIICTFLAVAAYFTKPQSYQQSSQVLLCLVEKCQWPPRSMPFLPASATSTRIALFKCNFNLHVYCCREVFTSFHVVIVALIIIMTIHSSTPPPSLPLPSDSLLDANGERGSNDDDDEWTSAN